MVQLVGDQDLCDLGAAELGRRLAAGRVSAAEALEAQLRRIEERNGALGAVVSLDADGARQRALAADDALAAGRPIGPLHGVPITLKDGNDVAGLPTTIGTYELDTIPVTDGTVAARLRAAGANIIGHTNVAAWLDGDLPPVPLTRRGPVGPADLRIAVAPGIPGAPVATALRDKVNQVAGAISDAGGQVREALPEISWQEQGELFGELIQLVTAVFTPDGADFRLARYLELLARRDAFIACWERFFEQYDALLMPPAATVAYPHCAPGTPLALDGGQIAYHEQGFVFALASLSGLPALVMPAGLDGGGLPAGIQLVGARWTEPLLLAIGRGLDNAEITPGFRPPPAESPAEAPG